MLVFKGNASEAAKLYLLIEQKDRALGLQGTPLEIGCETMQGGTTPHLSSDGDNFWPRREAFSDVSQVDEVSNGWARCTRVAICNSKGESSRLFQQGEQASFFSSMSFRQQMI